jgi:hypothetical protein
LIQSFEVPRTKVPILYFEQKRFFGSTSQFRVTAEENQWFSFSEQSLSSGTRNSGYFRESDFLEELESHARRNNGIRILPEF